MATRTLTFNGTQATNVNHGTVFSDTKADVGKSFVLLSGGDRPNSFFSANLPSGIGGRFEMNLIQDDLSIAQTLVGTTGGKNQLTIQLVIGDLAEGVGTVGNNFFSWVVSPTSFATGKMEIRIFGKIDAVNMSSIFRIGTGASDSYYSASISGNGVYEVIVPFTVVDV